MQTALEVVSALLKILGLLHEEVRGEHYAIADDVNLTSLENARRDAAEYILLAFKLKCVACIRTALKTCDHIILRGEDVNNLALTFVAPLQSEQDVNFSFVHIFPYFSFSVPEDRVCFLLIFAS